MSACVQHGSWGDYCGPECERLTRFYDRTVRAERAYRFRGRNGDTYTWARSAPDMPGYEEVISCNVDWFWGPR